MAVCLNPGAHSAPVCVSFDGTPYTTIGFMADVSLAGATVTTVRIAEHKFRGGAAFQKVTEFQITAASPKAVFTLQAETDSVTFSRMDDVNLVLYPNFAA